MAGKQKITKDMTFGAVLEKYPEAAEVFMKYGMHCIGCAIAVSETIEQGAQAHGIDVDEIMKELNKAVKNKKVK